MSYVSDLREKVGHDYPLQLPGTGIIVWRKNRGGGIELLLQLRTDVGKYGLLGGGIELGESYKECAIRELEEEAGLKTHKSALCLLKVYAGSAHISVYENGDVVYHTVVVYSLDYDYTTDTYTSLSSETKALKWMPLGEIKNLLREDAEKHFFHNNIPIFWDIVNKFFC